MGSWVLLCALLGTQISVSDAAYDCSILAAAGYGSWALKASPASITCDERRGECSPLECCDQAADGCYAYAMSGSASCPANQVINYAATGQTADACCADAPSCSTMTCPADEYKKAKANAASLKCTNTPCDDEDTCCEYDPAAAPAAPATPPTCGTIDPPASTQCAEIGLLYDDTKASETASEACCKPDTTKCSSLTESCATGKYKVDTDTGTTAAVCCKDLPTCDSYVMPTPPGGTVVSVASTHHASAMLMFVLLNFAKM